MYYETNLFEHTTPTQSADDSQGIYKYFNIA